MRVEIQRSFVRELLLFWAEGLALSSAAWATGYYPEHPRPGARLLDAALRPAGAGEFQPHDDWLERLPGGGTNPIVAPATLPTKFYRLFNS